MKTGLARLRMLGRCPPCLVALCTLSLPLLYLYIIPMHIVHFVFSSCRRLHSVRWTEPSSALKKKHFKNTWIFNAFYFSIIRQSIKSCDNSIQQFKWHLGPSSFLGGCAGLWLPQRVHIMKGRVHSNPVGDVHVDQAVLIHWFSERGTIEPLPQLLLYLQSQGWTVGTTAATLEPARSRKHRN